MSTELINLPNRIGRDRCTYNNGRPCCALGHYHSVLPSLRPPSEQWKTAFMAAAEALTGVTARSVVAYNDDVLSPHQRTVVYAAAFGLCGHEIDGPKKWLKEVNDLIAKTKTRNWRFK